MSEVSEVGGTLYRIGKTLDLLAATLTDELALPEVGMMLKESAEMMRDYGYMLVDSQVEEDDDA